MIPSLDCTRLEGGFERKGSNFAECCHLATLTCATSYFFIYLPWNLPDYKRVVAAVGPNMYNAEGYLKWGIYKPGRQFNRKIMA